MNLQNSEPFLYRFPFAFPIHVRWLSGCLSRRDSAPTHQAIVMNRFCLLSFRWRALWWRNLCLSRENGVQPHGAHSMRLSIEASLLHIFKLFPPSFISLDGNLLGVKSVDFEALRDVGNGIGEKFILWWNQMRNSWRAIKFLNHRVKGKEEQSGLEFSC